MALSRRSLLANGLSSPFLLRGALGRTGSVGALVATTPAVASDSAYSFRIGDNRITVLSDGGLSLPASTLAANVAPDQRTAFLTARGLDTRTRVSAINVTLIQTGDAIVLVDTGAGMNFFENAGLLADSFDDAGLDRDSITHVVLTHAHPDHVWGIIDDFDESERFPNARYLIGAEEWDYWMAPDFLSRNPERLHSFALGAQRNLGAVADKVSRVTGDHEVTHGVTMITTPGHTPGHMSVLVEGGGQQLLVVGDALTHSIVSFERPDWQPTTDLVPVRAVETRKRLLDRATADDMLLVGYHFPWPGVGRAEADGGRWRYVADG